MRLLGLIPLALVVIVCAAACTSPIAGSNQRPRVGEICVVDGDCSTDYGEACGYRLGDGCGVKGLCVAPTNSCPKRVDVELCLCDGTNFTFSCVGEDRPARTAVRSAGRCGAPLDGGAGDGASDAKLD